MMYESNLARRSVLTGSLAVVLGATTLGSRAAAQEPTAPARLANLANLASPASPANLASSAEQPEGPFWVVDGLLDLADENALGLPQAERAETVTIFAPGEEDLQFNHGESGRASCRGKT